MNIIANKKELLEQIQKEIDQIIADLREESEIINIEEIKNSIKYEQN